MHTLAHVKNPTEGEKRKWRQYSKLISTTTIVTEKKEASKEKAKYTLVYIVINSADM